MKKRIFSCVLSLMLLVGLLPTATVTALNVPESLKVSQTATNLDSDYISNVTMTIPSDSTQQPMDIVFVLDGSTSSDASTLATDAAEMLKELANVKTTNVHAGLVIFGGENPILYASESLGSIADDNVLETLTSNMTDKTYDGATGRSGSNLQAGIEKARTLLKTGSAESENKYLILLTDGGARMWINDEGESLAQLPYENNWNTTEDFIARYISGNLELRTFDQIMADAANGKEIGKYGITKEHSKDSAYLVKNLEPGMDVNTDLNYYSNLESATYFAAKSIIELTDADEANVFWIDYPYNKGSKYGDYTESFKSWLADENYVTRYDSDQIADPLAQLKDNLLYYVGEGSVIENEIGYGKDNYGNAYDFKMVNLDQLQLTVGSDKLTTTKIGENHYGFGTLNSEGKYPYELTYYPNGKDDSGKDNFELAINTAVYLDASIKLDYQVQLTNPQKVGGTYGTYDEDGSESLDSLLVSKEATFKPVYSDGTLGTEIPFPLPTVSYVVTPAVEETVKINIVPLTIYVGGDGYESVVEDSQGNVTSVTKNGLPEPGYMLELPESLNDWLREQLGISKDTAVDLTNYLTFTYDDGQQTRKWTLEHYDQNEGNSSQVNGRYLYRLVSSEDQPPVRLEFKDEDGNLTTSDDFTISQNHPNQTYTMSIHAGGLDQGLVKAEIKLPGATGTHSYNLEIEGAELKIRGVVSDSENITTAIVEGKEPQEAVTNITAQVSQGTEYYYKTTDNQVSSIQVADSSAVQLLVDEVLPTAKVTLEEEAVKAFDALPENYNIETKYLDLVYTNNGNAIVGANNPITIYWPYPEGTDENTEFFIVHYNGLDRNDDEALTDDYTMELYSADQEDSAYKLENTEKGIKITVDSFSPYALFWADDDAAADSMETPETGVSNMATNWMLLCGACAVVAAVSYKRKKAQ